VKGFLNVIGSLVIVFLLAAVFRSYNLPPETQVKMVDVFIGDGQETRFLLSHSAIKKPTVEMEGEELASEEWRMTGTGLLRFSEGNIVVISPPPVEGVEIVVRYRYFSYP